MKSSLSRQLIISTGIIYLVGTLVFGWFVGYSQSQRLLEDTKKETHIYVKAVAVSLLNSLSKNDISSVENVLNQYMLLNEFNKISIVSEDNLILTELLSRDGEIINPYSYGREFEYYIETDEYSQELSTSLTHSARTLGTLYAHTNFDQVKALKYNLWVTIFLSGVCIYLLVLLVMIVSLKNILRPLNKIAKFTRNFLSNMGSSVDVSTNITEIHDMVQAVNWSSKKLKKLEEELRLQADQLEQEVNVRTKELCLAKKVAVTANKEKTRFLSHMSHELRTPLNSILGFSQILIMKPDSMTDSQINNVTEINNSGNHLLNLVNEILDITKIEEGALDTNITNINVIQFYRNFYNSIKVLATDKEISIVLDMQVTASVNILADEKRLTQVMYNLVSNSIKFSHEKGLIIISVTVSEGVVKTEVSDTGIGIEEKDFTRVFDRFTRFDDINYAEGAGIGLHLTKELIELMDGTIDFSSEYGKGSKFWFTLPEAKVS